MHSSILKRNLIQTAKIQFLNEKNEIETIIIEFIDNQKTSPKKTHSDANIHPKRTDIGGLFRLIPNGRHNPCKYRHCELVSYFEPKLYRVIKNHRQCYNHLFHISSNLY